MAAPPSRAMIRAPVFLLLLTAAAVPAVAQPTPAAEPAPLDTDEALDAESAAEAEAEIVVTGQRERGAAIGDIEPEVQLDPAEIRAYGASSVAELLDALAPQTGSSRGRGGGRPVVLLNGRRVSGFREIRDIPPEAIQRVDILPEEVALSYGYRADQRVVNFVLRRRFEAVTAQAEQGIATAGGRGRSEIDLDLLRITREGRLNLDAEYERATGLLESERDIIGGEGAFRSLLPATETIELNGVYNRNIVGDVSGTVNASFEANRSESRIGLPEDDPIALEPLRRDSDSRDFHLGVSANGAVAPWQWTFTGNFDRGSADTRTERSPGNIDEARSVTQSADAGFLANGPLFDLPAGAVRSSVRWGFETLGIRSVEERGGILSGGEVSRNIGNVQASVDLPIASRRRDVLAPLGDLSVNANARFDRLSDFGTLRTLGAGINWSPIEQVDFLASYTDEDGAPTVQQLGDPIVFTPNVRMFDFSRGETVDVTRIEGGNADLIADNRRVLKLGITVKPLDETDLTLRADYTSSRIRDAISAFPAITTEIESAFGERFLRGADGRLLRIDTRPVNFGRVDRRDLRWGFDFSKPLGRQQTEEQRQQRREARREARQGGGGARGRGGFGGGRYGGGRGGRLQLALFHTWRLQDSILIRQGVPELDLLNGSAAGSRGGTSEHEVQLRAGYFRGGFGARLNANWQSGTSIEGGTGESDLRFSDLTTVNLRLFANLGQQRALVTRYPWLRGTRISLDVDNIFDTRLRVRDEAGVTPLGYQSAFLDPLGRAVSISFRKLFF